MNQPNARSRTLNYESAMIDAMLVHADSIRSRASSSQASSAPQPSISAIARWMAARSVGLRCENGGELSAFIEREPAHRLRDRRGDLAGRDVLTAILSVFLETAEVEYVVDDLKGEAERLEQAPDGIGLVVGAAAEERGDARDRTGGCGRLQPSAWR